MNDLDGRDELARELHHRSHDVGGHPVSLGSVKRSARRIQVRRRVATGAVAAMVLVLAVPAAVAVTDDVTRSDFGPASPGGPTEGPSRSASDDAEEFPEGPVRLKTQGLPRGGDPELSYVVHGERELVTREGSLDLPADVTMMTPFRDGWLALGSRSGEGQEAIWYDADLDVVRSRPTIGSTLAVGVDGSQVAWTEVEPGSREVTLLGAPTSGGDPRAWPVPSREEVVPVGFLGDGRVVFTDVVSSLNGIAEPDGTLTELDGFLHLTSASQAAGLVAGQTSYDIGEACAGVMDPDRSTSELLWEGCDHVLGAFSPDGRYVLGTPSDADGMGPASFAVLDARTGEELVAFTPRRDDPVSLYQLAWEDDETVVAMVYDEGDVLMLRFGLGGGIEQIGPTGVSQDMSLPIWFAGVPRR